MVTCSQRAEWCNTALLIYRKQGGMRQEIRVSANYASMTVRWR
jgi:hypothetical protein